MAKHLNSTRLRIFFSDETGSTAIEYALIAGLIGLSVIGGSSAIRTQLSIAFANMAAQLAAAVAAN